MAYTSEQLTELSIIIAMITQLSSALSVEGQIDPANRLLSTDNVTNLNSNIEELSDYLGSLVPPT